MIYNEVLFEYFEACKKAKIPYLEPPGFILQGIFAQFGNRGNGFKARIEAKVKESAWGSVFLADQSLGYFKVKLYLVEE